MDDDNTKISPGLTVDADDQDASKQLEDLLSEAKEVENNIGEISRDINDSLDAIDKDVDVSAGNVDQLCSELDKADAEAGDALDKVILGQAEEVAKE